MQDFDSNTDHPRPARKQPPERWRIASAATRSYNARRDHDSELKMEQSVLSLLIKNRNGSAIQIPLVGAANKAASGMVRYPAARQPANGWG